MICSQAGSAYYKVVKYTRVERIAKDRSADVRFRCGDRGSDLVGLRGFLGGKLLGRKEYGRKEYWVAERGGGTAAPAPGRSDKGSSLFPPATTAPATKLIDKLIHDRLRKIHPATARDGCILFRGTGPLMVM